MTKQRLGLAIVSIIAFVPAVAAHYHLLLPDAPTADKSVHLRLLFGHPYEHELFDAVAPDSIGVIAPDGSYRDLTGSLKPSSQKTAAGEVKSFTLECPLEKRGDHIFVAVSPPIWMKEERRFYQDTVRVVVHHQTQVGWDRALGKGFEMVPLTRPYGLQPGMVFQAQATLDGNAAKGLVVEVEQFNETPPKELPEDEQMTRLVKTDPNGVATCSLTDAGWWCLTARRDGGHREHEGKMYPVLQRSTLWVHVGAARPAPK